MSPLSESRARANKKWNDANLTRISVAVPKELGDRIKSAAESAGLSVNAYIRKAVEESLDK